MGNYSDVETEYLNKILETIYSNFNMSQCEAITLEGNVRNLSDDEKQKWFISSGGTRVSFGIQTFKEELKYLFFSSLLNPLYFTL